MGRSVRAALGRTRIGTHARGLRRDLMGAWTPLKNTLVGCRVHARGTGNRVACAQTRQLSKATITIVGNSNSVVFAHEAQVRSCTIVIRGDGNRVWIGPSYLNGASATISGNGNIIAIEGGCMLLSLGLVCEDDANSISIGAATQIHGSTELAAIEGTRIAIGEGCCSPAVSASAPATATL